ncbi:putative effector of murein hydrolase [Paenibacillus sp. V4I9]|uniref:hypothetical protein n=1 Tax=Paenibacillus sp. V4I9 TaxID=3042308 RepID=UPI00278058B2|nr:hypothetical protein [Paenibacillus sp. V4I9]MDQ0888868.1 putative effector of murein hydrolase [Paenibacillus sp. V4I9]
MGSYVFPEFIFLRPVFVTFILALLVVMVIVVFQKKKLLNLFSVLFISSICCSVSALTIYASGYIVDEYNLGGDEISFFMFLAIVALSILNILIYLSKNNRRYENGT